MESTTTMLIRSTGDERQFLSGQNRVRAHPGREGTPEARPRSRERREIFPEGHVKSTFLCNLGYGDPANLHPRLPRLSFEEACTLV